MVFFTLGKLFSGLYLIKWIGFVQSKGKRAKKWEKARHLHPFMWYLIYGYQGTEPSSQKERGKGSNSQARVSEEEVCCYTSIRFGVSDKHVVVWGNMGKLYVCGRWWGCQLVTFVRLTSH